MYSKNDYRYYLEHRLAETDDYFAHYGIKGMKWRHHKRLYDDATKWSNYWSDSAKKESSAFNNRSPYSEFSKSQLATKTAHAVSNHARATGHKAVIDSIESKKRRRIKKLSRIKNLLKRQTSKDLGKKVGKNTYVTSHHVTIG